MASSLIRGGSQETGSARLPCSYNTGTYLWLTHEVESSAWKLGNMRKPVQCRGHAPQRSVAEACSLGSTHVVEALGSWASSLGACVTSLSLLWRVLRSPLRVARAGPHAAPSRSGFALVPLGPGEARPSGSQPQDWADLERPLPFSVPSTARRSGSSQCWCTHGDGWVPVFRKRTQAGVLGLRAGTYRGAPATTKGEPQEGDPHLKE